MPRPNRFLWCLKDERPHAVYVPKASRNEVLVFAFLSMVSITAASLIAWDIHRLVYSDHQIFPWSWLLLGVAHGFVFAGLLSYIRVKANRAFQYALSCVLFPIWGPFITVCGGFGVLYLFAIVLCSMVWGFVLWYLLEDVLAFIAFVFIGIFPVSIVFFISSQNGNAAPNWYVEGAIAMWHIPASIAVLILGFRRRSVLAKQSTARCQACGYDCVGIEEQGVCPECGCVEIAVSKYSLTTHPIGEM